MPPTPMAARLSLSLGRCPAAPANTWLGTMVKAAVALLGRATPELRLPLAPVAEANLAKLKDAMVRFGLRLA